MITDTVSAVSTPLEFARGLAPSIPEPGRRDRGGRGSCLPISSWTSANAPIVQGGGCRKAEGGPRRRYRHDAAGDRRGWRGRRLDRVVPGDGINTCAKARSSPPGRPPPDLLQRPDGYLGGLGEPAGPPVAVRAATGHRARFLPAAAALFGAARRLQGLRRRRAPAAAQRTS